MKSIAPCLRDAVLDVYDILGKQEVKRNLLAFSVYDAWSNEHYYTISAKALVIGEGGAISSYVKAGEFEYTIDINFEDDEDIAYFVFLYQKVKPIQITCAPCETKPSNFMGILKYHDIT